MQCTTVCATVCTIGLDRQPKVDRNDRHHRRSSAIMIVYTHQIINSSDENADKEFGFKNACEKSCVLFSCLNLTFAYLFLCEMNKSSFKNRKYETRQNLEQL